MNQRNQISVLSRIKKTPLYCGGNGDAMADDVLTTMPTPSEIRAAVRRKIIGAEGQHVWLETPPMEAYKRDELVDTICSVKRKGQRYERQDVIHAVARRLGFSRVTEKVEAPINSAIRRGLLRYREDVVWREEWACPE